MILTSLDDSNFQSTDSCQKIYFFIYPHQGMYLQIERGVTLMSDFKKSITKELPFRG